MNLRTGVLIVLTIVLSGCDVGSVDLPVRPPAPLSTPAGGALSPTPPPPPPPPDSNDIGTGAYPLPLSVPVAEEILLNTGVFNFHNPPRASHYAYLALIDLPDGVSRMQAIARRGGRAGQLYALCALWERAPTQAAALADELGTVSDEVIVWDNDVRSVRRVSEVVAMIRATELWRWFRDPSDTRHGLHQLTG